MSNFLSRVIARHSGTLPHLRPYLYAAKEHTHAEFTEVQEQGQRGAPALAPGLTDSAPESSSTSPWRAPAQTHRPPKSATIPEATMNALGQPAELPGVPEADSPSLHSAAAPSSSSVRSLGTPASRSAAAPAPASSRTVLSTNRTQPQPTSAPHSTPPDDAHTAALPDVPGADSPSAQSAASNSRPRASQSTAYAQSPETPPSPAAKGRTATMHQPAPVFIEPPGTHERLERARHADRADLTSLARDGSRAEASVQAPPDSALRLKNATARSSDVRLIPTAATADTSGRLSSKAAQDIPPGSVPLFAAPPRLLPALRTHDHGGQRQASPSSTAQPRSSRRSSNQGLGHMADAPPQVVRVHIGRVEIRKEQPAAPPPPQSPPLHGPPSTLALTDYLKEHATPRRTEP